MSELSIKRAMEYADEHYNVRKGLKFHKHMTLQAAARIANQHGCELRVCWDGKQAVVEAVPIHKDEDIPAFLRPQAGPLCDEDFEKVISLRQLGV